MNYKDSNSLVGFLWAFVLCLRDALWELCIIGLGFVWSGLKGCLYSLKYLTCENKIGQFFTRSAVLLVAVAIIVLAAIVIHAPLSVVDELRS